MNNNIKTFRRKQGITQKGLAERTGLKQSYISRIEQGKVAPSIWTALKISKALNVPLRRLFDIGGK